MKVKTSLSLSEDLLESIDRLAGPDDSRSAFIERILRRFVDERALARREARDVAALNKKAARLNAEMADVLSFQALSEE